MKSMHRQFGRLKTRSTDDSDVAVLLRDFNEADNLTSKVFRPASCLPAITEIHTDYK